MDGEFRLSQTWGSLNDDPSKWWEYFESPKRKWKHRTAFNDHFSPTKYEEISSQLGNGGFLQLLCGMNIHAAWSKLGFCL